MVTNNLVRTQTILLVDDCEDILEVMTHIFKKVGYRVLSSMSLRGAIQFLSKESVDLVICDYHLPDGSAVDLKITIEKHNPKVTILLTGAGACKGLNAPCFDICLSKPIEPITLISIVRTCLRLSAGLPRNN